MPMPTKRDSTAPIWDRDASELQEFLEDVKALADENGLSEAQAIAAALRYAPSEDSGAWRYTDGCSASSWIAFEADVLALYPGAKENEWCTVRALEALVSAQATKPITSQSELGQFYRDFLAASGALAATGRIGTGERDRLFVKGFHPAFRSKIIAYYSYRFPQHQPYDPYPFNDFRAAADRILAGGLPEFSLTVADPSEAKPIKAEAHQESEVLAILRAMQVQLSALSIRVAEYTTASTAAFIPACTAAPAHTDVPAAATASAPSYAPVFASAQQLDRSVCPPILCTFCGKRGEFIRQCPVVREYVRVGKAVQDTANGWLTVPGGGSLPYVLNGTLKDRFDAFHSARPTASATCPTFSGSHPAAFVAAEVPQRPHDVPHSTDVFLQPDLRSHQRAAAVMKRTQTSSQISSPPTRSCRTSSGNFIGDTGDPLCDATVRYVAPTHHSTLSYRRLSPYDNFGYGTSDKAAPAVRIRHLPAHYSALVSVVKSSHSPPLHGHPTRFNFRLAARTAISLSDHSEATVSSFRSDRPRLKPRIRRSDQGRSEFFVSQ